MSQRRKSQIKTAQKKQPLVFEDGKYYYYKQDDSDPILLKCCEDTTEQEPDLGIFEVFKIVHQDKTNIYYDVETEDDPDQDFDSSKFVLKEAVQHTVQKKNIKGEKIEVTTVKLSLINGLEGISSVDEKKSKRVLKESATRSRAKKKVESESEQEEQEEESEQEEEEEEEEEEEKPQKKGVKKTVKGGKAVAVKKETPKTKAKAKETKAKSTTRSKTPQKKETKKQTQSQIKKSKKQQEEEEEQEIEQEEEEEEEEEKQSESFEEIKPTKGKQKKSEPKTKKAPQKKQPLKKQQKKQEEEEEESEKEEEIQEEKKKKKAPAAKKEKKAKAPPKPKKPVEVFKKGKWNQRIEELVEKSGLLEDGGDEIKNDGNAMNANKELIRAAFTGNKELMKKLLSSKKVISSVFQRYAPENDFNVIEVLIKYGDKELLKMMVDFLINQPKEFQYTRNPKMQLKHIDTGYNNKYAYGVATRKVNLGRGGKEGNNAFVYDLNQEQSFSDYMLESILECETSHENIDLLRLLQNNYNLDSTINSKLGYVVRCGNYKLAQKLVEIAVQRQGWGYNKLHNQVLLQNDQKDLPKFDQNQALQQSSGYHRMSPYLLACINPSTEILKRIVKECKGCVVQDEMGRKPVHYAAACFSPGNLKYLLEECNANAKEIDRINQTSPLHIASQYGRIKNVELLLSDEKYYDLKKKNLEGNLPIHLAARNGHVSVVKFFKEEKGVKLAVPGKDKWQCLHFAAAYDHFELVEYIVQNKGNINSKDKFKRSPLMMAVRNNNVKIVSYLLQKGAEYDHVDSSDNSALHYAAAYGWHECIELLLKAGANINSQNSWNLTPLSVALMKCQNRCVDSLLKYDDIDVNCRDDEGKSLLYLEIIQYFENFSVENHEIMFQKIRQWLEKGADPNIADINGKIPLHYLGQNFDSIIRNAIQEDSEYAPDYLHALHMPALGEVLSKNQERDNRLFQEIRELAEKEAKEDKDWPQMEVEQLNDTVKLQLIQKYYRQIARNRREEVFQKYHQESVQKLVKLLLEFKSDVNRVDTGNQTPIQAALQSSQYKVFEILMEDENTDIKKGFGTDGVYHTLVRYLPNEFVFKVLYQIMDKYQGLDGQIGYVNNLGYSPLHVLLERGINEINFQDFEKLIRRMVELGADVNQKVLKLYKYREGNRKLLKQEKKINIMKKKSENLIQRELSKTLKSKQIEEEQEQEEEIDFGEVQEEEEQEIIEEVQQEQEEGTQSSFEKIGGEGEENEDKIEEEQVLGEDEEEDGDFEVIEGKEDLEEEEELEEELEDQEEEELLQGQDQDSDEEDEESEEEQHVFGGLFGGVQHQRKEKEEDEQESEEYKKEKKAFKKLQKQYNNSDQGEWSVFHFVVEYQSLVARLVALFVELGADYNAVDIHNKSAFHLYIKKNSQILVKDLEAFCGLKDVKVDYKEKLSLNTLLHSYLEKSVDYSRNLVWEEVKEKTQQEKDEIVKKFENESFEKLLELTNVNLSELNQKQQTPLQVLFSGSNYKISYFKAMFKFPEQVKNSLNLQDSQGQTILHMLIYKNLQNEENLKIMRDNDALESLVVQDKKKENTPLHYLFRQRQDGLQFKSCLDILLDNEYGKKALQINNKKQNTILHKLCKDGKNTQNIEQVLKHYPKDEKLVNFINKKGFSPLHLFVTKVNEDKQSTKIFRKLVEFGADVKLLPPLDFQDRSPVILALEQKKYRFIQVMVQNGAEINFGHEYYQAYQQSTSNLKVDNEFVVIKRKLTNYSVPLLNAVKEQNEDSIQILLQEKADANFQDKQKRNSLHHALNTQGANTDACFENEKLLLKYGGKILQDEHGRTPLHYCFTKFRQSNQDSYQTQAMDPFESVNSLCTAEKLDVNAKDDQGKTALHYAAVRNASMSARYLIRNGAQIDAKDKLGNTPLGLAFLNNWFEVATILIEKGADVNQYAIVDEKEDRYTGNSGQAKGEHSLFKLALQRGQQGISFLLMEFGYDQQEACQSALQQKQYNLFRSLLFSIQKNDFKSMKPNKKDGKNIFHYFAQYGNGADQKLRDIFYKELIEREVDFNLQDQEEKSPLVYAIENQFNILVDRLVKLDNIKINLQDKKGLSCLHSAIQHQNKYAVQLLLENQDVDITLVDGNKRSVLHYFCYQYVGSHFNQNNLHQLVQMKNKALGKEQEQDKQQQCLIGQGLLLQQQQGDKKEVKKEEIEDEQDYSNYNYGYNSYGNRRRKRARQRNYHSKYNIDRIREITQEKQQGQQSYGYYHHRNYSYNNSQEQLSVKVVKNEQDQLLMLMGRIEGKNILNLQDDKGRTALSTAVYQENTFILNLLLLWDDIDIYLQDEMGFNALHLSCMNQNIFSIFKQVNEFMKRDKLDLARKTKEEESIMHICARYKNLTIFEHIQEGDYDVNALNKKNQSALHLAVQAAQKEFYLKLFENKNVDVSVRDVEGKLPVHYAVENSDLLALHYLLKHNSQIKVRDNEYQSILNICIQKQFFKGAAKILDYSLQSINEDDKIDLKKDFVSVYDKVKYDEKQMEELPKAQTQEIEEFIQGIEKGGKEFLKPVKYCLKVEEKEVKQFDEKKIEHWITYVELNPVLYYSLMVQGVQEILQGSGKEKSGNNNINQFHHSGFGMKKRPAIKATKTITQSIGQLGTGFGGNQGLFGQQQNQQKCGGIFGQSQPQQQPQYGLFGQQQPQQGLFGQSQPKQQYFGGGRGGIIGQPSQNPFNINQNIVQGIQQQSLFNMQQTQRFVTGSQGLSNSIPAQQMTVKPLEQQIQVDSMEQIEVQLGENKFEGYIKLLMQCGGNPHEVFSQQLVQQQTSKSKKVIDALRQDAKEQCLLYYYIQENDLLLVKLLIQSSSLDTKKFFDQYQKSALHLVVNPLEYGSYENEEMFEALAEKFDVNQTDAQGFTSYDYAVQQDSQKLAKCIEKLGGKVSQKNKKLQMKRAGTSIISTVQWPEQELDYEEDSKNLLEKITKKYKLNDKYVPECDHRAYNSGIGTEKGVSIVQDEQGGYYDLKMTKVDVRQGQYGQNVYYKMQVIHSKARDIYFVFTNWGRIGTSGQYQCTPFNKRDEAIALFTKIFKEKAGNDWKERENFEKKKGKYMLQKKKKFIDYSKYIKNFDFENIEKKQKIEAQIEKQIGDLVKEITNLDQVRRSYSDQSLDVDLFTLDKSNINQGWDILQELKEMVKELNEMKKDLLNKDMNVIFELIEKIADKSSDYYLNIPENGFNEEALPPIEDESTIEQKLKVLSSLKDLELTAKIILGAHKQLDQNKISPVDYCYNSLNTRVVPLQHKDKEYKLIQKYLNAGKGYYNNERIKNIFAVERKGEAERISQYKHLPNRKLLWHGTKGYNLMSIFANGLQTKPVFTSNTGSLFGPGIYFSDKFQKAFSYSWDWGQQKHKYILLCEVALGESKVYNDYDWDFNENFKPLENPYKSVKGQANEEPDAKKDVVLPNGAIMPAGPLVDVDLKGEESGLSDNEYIVYDGNQVRIRYLIQIKSGDDYGDSDDEDQEDNEDEDEDQSESEDEDDEEQDSDEMEEEEVEYDESD